MNSVTDLLLTHGYFLWEDEKEREIMKPYAPLGLLYISAYLKRAGFDVEVFDTTFSDRASLVTRLAATPGGVLGVYTNLMTRANVFWIAEQAHLHRLDGRLRRSRECQLSRRVPRARRRCRGARRGRGHARGAAAGHPRPRPAPAARRGRHGVPRRGRRDRAQRRPRQGRRHRLAAVARPRGHRHAAVRRHVAHAPRHGIGQPHHRPRLPVQVQLVQPRRVRLLAPPPQSHRLRRRGASTSSRPTSPNRSGTPTTCSRSATSGCSSTPPR